jgi:hypothetical protein
MAELTTKERNALPASAFVFPGQRAYPIQDEEHARNALSRVSQFGTPAEKAAVRKAVYSRYPNIGREGAARMRAMKRTK